MGGIFISYRREDAPFAAAWLFEKLSEEFGADGVFKDVEDILPGEKWPFRLKDALNGADVVLAVIGAGWSVHRANSTRRIDDDDDPVRREIVDALRREIEVIPVLLASAEIPRELPDDLKPLREAQAASVGPMTFADDVNRLVRTLRASVEAAGGRKSRVRALLDKALQDYERANTLPFGAERTNQVHRAMQVVSRLAMTAGLAPAEIDERLQRDRRSGACLLLGSMRTDADPRRFQEILEAIEKPQGPQEQFLALDIIDRMLPLLDRSDREAVALVITTQPYLNDRANKGRYRRAMGILGKIKDFGPAFQ